MEAAIYARVSTERQDLQQTIDSQLAILTAWVQQHGHHLAPAHIYCDRGVSGSRLDRPALDRLRDEAQAGTVDLVAILTPDRLARKYAYQALLLDELRRAGCEVVFVQHPISDDPHDQLLLQIQAAVAEYERAMLGERFRRGKLHKAQAGQVVSHVAPYGYRYIPKQEDCPGHLVIDETEAEVVRLLYRWLIDDRLTIRQILKRLNTGPWRTRSGRTCWSTAVVHHILADPVYSGTAYANRYAYDLPMRPRRPGSRRADAPSCRRLKPEAEWIAIAVPAIIDHPTAEQAQAQLARNATLSFRNNQKYTYLLRCLLTCGSCGLAMCGITHRATARQPERRYYKCAGKDPIFSGRGRVCTRRAITATEVETAVWQHIEALLTEPARLLAQFRHQLELATEGDAQERAETQRLTARLDRLGREERRLLDAYQAGIITMAEVAERRELVGQRRQAVEEERAQQARLRRERAQAQTVLSDLTAFCARVRSRLANATFEDQQAILQLLIERIIVYDDKLEIHHVIPLRGTADTSELPGLPADGLRSDGLDLTALPTRPGVPPGPSADPAPP